MYKLYTQANHHGRSLYENNKAIYSLLRYGVHVKTDAGEPTETVEVIDWEHPEENDFAVGEEVTLAGTMSGGPISSSTSTASPSASSS